MPLQKETNVFISQETYQKLIGAARAQYKPYLPTQEALLYKELNTIPGVLCTNIHITVHDSTKLTIECLFRFTYIGLVNYGLLFQEYTSKLEQALELKTVIINRPHQPRDGKSELRTRHVLLYQITSKDKEGLQKLKDDTFLRMIDLIKNVPFAELLNR